MTGPAATPVSSTSLPYQLKNALSSAGYNVLTDLVGLDASDLSTDLGVVPDQANLILSLVNGGGDDTSEDQLDHQRQGSPSKAPAASISASDMLQSHSGPRFSFMSGTIDQLIGNFTGMTSRTTRKGKERAVFDGTVLPGTNLELSGPPGSGKTSMVIALALSARLHGITDPVARQEQGVEVLVVDTEGAISAQRLAQAASVITRDSEVSPAELLSGIHLLRIATQVQMIAFLNTLDEWLEQHSQVRLVLVDTLSYHFRQPSLDMRTKSRIMDLIKLQTGKATSMNKCAVVVTNQLATKLLTADNKPGNFDNGERAVLMPQLGDSWTTTNTIRLVLFRGARGDDLRYAHATSAAGSKNIPWMRYDIDTDGLPCDPVFEVHNASS